MLFNVAGLDEQVRLPLSASASQNARCISAVSVIDSNIRLEVKLPAKTRLRLVCTAIQDALFARSNPTRKEVFLRRCPESNGMIPILEISQVDSNYIDP
jgi:hypothetical protein